METQHNTAYGPLRAATLTNLQNGKESVERIKFRHLKWQQWQEADLQKMLDECRQKNDGEITEEVQEKYDQSRKVIRERREELENIFALLETSKMLFEYLEVTGTRNYDQGFEKGKEFGFLLAKVQYRPETTSEHYWKQRAQNLRLMNPETDLLTRLIAATPLKEL